MSRKPSAYLCASVCFYERHCLREQRFIAARQKGVEMRPLSLTNGVTSCLFSRATWKSDALARMYCIHSTLVKMPPNRNSTNRPRSSAFIKANENNLNSFTEKLVTMLISKGQTAFAWVHKPEEDIQKKGGRKDFWSRQAIRCHR